MPTKVALVEDNAGICEELEQIISEQQPNMTCVGVCRNARTALQRIPQLSPDVIIMDVQLPDGSGIEVTAKLKRQLPDTQILMFTVHEDTEQIYKALEAGASGYLLKRTAAQNLVRAIQEVKEGGVPMTGEVARKVIASFRKPSAPAAEKLTRREEEIMQLLVVGCLSKEIADKLSIGLETVNSHLKHIYEKLHVRSRTEAVVKYLK
ncbi:MAG: response regulator transcription factor [Nibricoccus sp.]